MEEIWKDIKGYEQLYQISNLGRVKSLGNGGTWKTGIILKLLPQNSGYNRVALCKKGKRKYYLVHRLVYEAFYGKIPFWMQVNHINEDKTDNRLCNLNIMTAKQNINWGTAIDRTKRKLSKPVLQYSMDGTFIKEWPSAREVERQLGFNSTSISRCCSGKYKQMNNYKWKYKEVG